LAVQKFCSHECCDSFHAKVKNKPTKKELKNMIDTMTWVDIGKKYGVSNNAVKKWAKKYKMI